MALFTDSDVVSADMLQAIDSEVRTAAAAAKPAILLDGRMSICEAAWEECGRRVLAAMQSYVSYPAQTGMPATHIAAVHNTGVPARTQTRVRLNQIVANAIEYSAMSSRIEKWVVYYALYLLFRDASSRLNQDRFQEKMERYQDAAMSQWHGLRTEGLPMVARPLEAPGAKHGFRPGTWSADNLTAIDGGTNAADQPVQVAITYYDSSRYRSQSNNGNAESGPSQIVPFIIPANQLLRVDITSLNPSNGQPDAVGMSQGIVTPLAATHWNLWVGATADNLRLQIEGIPIDVKQQTLSGDPLATGPGLGRGQYADQNLVFLNIVNRG